MSVFEAMRLVSPVDSIIRVSSTSKKVSCTADRRVRLTSSPNSRFNHRLIHRQVLPFF